MQRREPLVTVWMLRGTGREQEGGAGPHQVPRWMLESPPPGGTRTQFSFGAEIEEFRTRRADFKVSLGSQGEGTLPLCVRTCIFFGAFQCRGKIILGYLLFLSSETSESCGVDVGLIQTFFFITT